MTSNLWHKAGLVVILFFAGAPALVWGGSEETGQVERARDIIETIMAIPEQSIPPALLNNAYGVAVIPGIIKAGFIVGGSYGKGVLMVRTHGQGWSAPAFIKLIAGSVGFQIGAQASDAVLVFKRRQSIDKITRGKFTLGADANIAAGPVGRSTSAGTDVALDAEIYSYSRSKGIFAGVSLEGASLQIDYEANRRYYGPKGATARDIFYGGRLSLPRSAQYLRQVVNKHAG